MVCFSNEEIHWNLVDGKWHLGASPSLRAVCAIRFEMKKLFFNEINRCGVKANTVNRWPWYINIVSLVLCVFCILTEWLHIVRFLCWFRLLRDFNSFSLDVAMLFSRVFFFVFSLSHCQLIFACAFIFIRFECCLWTMTSHAIISLVDCQRQLSE